MPQGTVRGKEAIACPFPAVSLDAENSESFKKCAPGAGGGRCCTRCVARFKSESRRLGKGDAIPYPARTIRFLQNNAVASFRPPALSQL